MNYYRQIIALFITVLMVFQPLADSRGESVPGNLAPGVVSANSPLTPERAEFSLEDAPFLDFALFLYKEAVEDGLDFLQLSEKIAAHPFWQESPLKNSLERDFVTVEKNVLIIKFKNGGIVRVYPLDKYKPAEDGSVQGGEKPQVYHVTGKHLIQYFSPSDKGQPNNMIMFGPALSYSALEINTEIKGVYITTEEVEEGPRNEKVLKFVCRTEEGASDRAKEIAEMLGQVVVLLNDIKNLKNGKLTRYLVGLIDDMKFGVKNRKIFVESAFNLKANSTHYWNRIVFNDRLLNFLYDMWESHRLESTSDHYVNELGALMMLAERLFHEIEHDSDEVRQVLKDQAFFEVVLEHNPVWRMAVRYNIDTRVDDESGHDERFGESFASNRYFAMIQSITRMTTETEMRKAIRDYLASVYRKTSSRQALNFSPKQMEYARGILADHNINDDLFGEEIFSMDFTSFFKLHCLFTEMTPYKDPYVEHDRKQWVNLVYKEKPAKIRERILSISRLVGKEDQTSKRLIGRHTKKKLCPLLQWASNIAVPQNYEKINGKLFGKIYYEGLNLFTIPVLPIDANGEIMWDLFKWVYAKKSAHLRDRAPPREYFMAKRISLYEYVITHTKESPETTDSQQEEPLDEVEKNIQKIHELTTEVSHAKTIDKVTHILIERNIPAVSQDELVTLIHKNSREPLTSEKIHFLDINGIREYLQDDDVNEENTVIFLSHRRTIKSEIGKTGFSKNVVVVEKETPVDFVNLEGLIGMARSALNEDWGSFKSLYRALTGKSVDWLLPPDIINMTLPRLSIIDVGEQKRYNGMLKRTLVAA